VEVTLVLGPAGSGKTFRCLKEAQQELKRSPDGLPLVFLAPKQATYQLERELLSDPDLPGFTRLHVAGFESLARLILQQTAFTQEEVLSDLGRVMILRALLTRESTHLRTFHASARMQGFAQQLSAILNEFQQARISGEDLRTAAACNRMNAELRDKLLDLAHLLERYSEWLHQNDLFDPSRLLSVAAEALSRPESRSSVRFDGLWLDGFAELSEQELELLVALVQRSPYATLAFCTDVGVTAEPPWHSIWNNVSRTIRRCYTRLQAIPNVRITIQQLSRDSARRRFSDAALAHLEKHWTTGKAFNSGEVQQELLPLFTATPPVKVIPCRNPAQEATVCAREILAAVRFEKRRFRDIAVLLRSLKGYDDVFCREFARYEIPYFLDRREGVAHHPLAELIRYALRLRDNGWAQEDWLGALKTGLLLNDDDALDALENEALARGWDGEAWLQPFPDSFERLRSQFVQPFQKFAEATKEAITGPQLAAAFRQLFADLDVAGTLQRWSELPVEQPQQTLLRAEVHSAVWRTIDEWLEAVELAFEITALPTTDWLPIVEAALANLTVGVIPPALDQVLIGTVDRSRNPDLQMALILGLNETVFPAPPTDAVLLSEYERGVLRDFDMRLGPTPHEQLGNEQYLAYIGCTRARERLVLTYSERNSSDTPLNPSIIIQHVRDLLPQVKEAPPDFDWHRDALHMSELVAPLLKGELAGKSLLSPVVARFQSYQAARSVEWLSAELVRQLYGPELSVSVSQLEDYAACSFRFFVKRGLRAEERKEFKVDRRLTGIFQHNVLQRFHERLTAEGKRWRDIRAPRAKELVRQIGLEVQRELEGGIFTAAPEWRFAAESIIQGLERLMAVLIGWAPQYEFEPSAVELGFGGPGDPLPAWRIELGDGRVLALRGRVDRVDLDSSAGRAWVVVMDYKASGQHVDDLRLVNGLDLQLIGYLAALRSIPEAAALLKQSALLPAGGFYLRLRNATTSAKSREEALAPAPELYKHMGRFRGDLRNRFDNRGEGTGDQFNFRVTKADMFHKNCKDPVEPEVFEGLVASTEDLLRQFAQTIYAGDVRINPFRYKYETACQKCDYASVCRFDPWTQPYRALAAAVDSHSASLQERAEARRE
jgi:ATP-dependent helicase/nuclease subunit B